jgi:hypothetical protein
MQIATYLCVLAIPHYRNILFPLHSFVPQEVQEAKFSTLRIFSNRSTALPQISERIQAPDRNTFAATHKLIRLDIATYVPPVSDTVWCVPHEIQHKNCRCSS